MCVCRSRWGNKLDFGSKLDDKMLPFLTLSMLMKLQIWRMVSRWGIFSNCSQFFLILCIRIKHECYLPQDFLLEWEDIFHPFDVGFGHLTCFSQWNVGRNDSMPVPSQGLQRNHTPIWFLVIHHEKHEADLDLARAWSPVQHSQTQPKSAELQSCCRSVGMKINDFHLSYWDFDIVCSKT